MALHAKEGVYVIEPDRHFPYHDPRFSNVVLETISIIRPDGYINLGDLGDFPQISTHDKDPREMRRVEEDIEDINAYLDDIEGTMPKHSVVHLLEGNHEYRMMRYAMRQAKDVIGLLPSWAQNYHFTERNRRGRCRWFHHAYPKWQSLRLGNTLIHHGKYFDKHTAASNLGRYRNTNFIQGHTHRVQYATNGDTWSATLGHGQMPGMHHEPTPGEHDQAIGILTVTARREDLEIYRVVNGQAVVRGRVIQG